MEKNKMKVVIVHIVCLLLTVALDSPINELFSGSVFSSD